MVFAGHGEAETSQGDESLQKMYCPLLLSITFVKLTVANRQLSVTVPFISCFFCPLPSRASQYCHYVAGLVGIGLSRLFSASELEDPVVGQDTELANSMGLFLQKTNIIRDYLEDQLEGREFWPREVRANTALGRAFLLCLFGRCAKTEGKCHCCSDTVSCVLSLEEFLLEFPLKSPKPGFFPPFVGVHGQPLTLLSETCNGWSHLGHRSQECITGCTAETIASLMSL